MHSFLRDRGSLRASLEAAVKAAPDTQKAAEIKVFLKESFGEKDKK